LSGQPKLLLFLSCIGLTPNLFAAQYKTLLCSDAASAQVCSVKCDDISVPNIHKDFLIDKKTSSVMSRALVTKDQQGVRGGTVLSSEVYRNCSIFNDKNWDCSESKEDSHFSEGTTRRMMEGRYYEHSFVILKKSDLIPKSMETHTYFCMKSIDN
jgi:hypothetical protein